MLNYEITFLFPTTHANILWKITYEFFLSPIGFQSPAYHEL